ncbi:histidine kinase [Marinicella sp. S1101]|uniref:sensor histidine kinase n=1 Tax=Marinicella marina TaxID=2996016 RepID=UPI00226100E1|nr:histidine kinase [Marinicella marina]MCX7553647.1 histidine kinase [Marinicella marina]MDJ1140271.1 histidine kinase [Marinicella marina]
MKRSSYAWLLLFWLLVGALYLFSLYLDALRFNTGFKLDLAVVTTTALVYAGWALVTAVLYRFLRQPINAGRVLYSALVFIAGLLTSIPLITLLDRLVIALIEGRELPHLLHIFDSIQYVYVFFNVLLYILVFIVCAGIIFQQRSKQLTLQASELAREQVEVKMLALQTQLSPHFLFNCLNAISGLTRVADKKQVIQAIARLGDLLRYAVNASQKNLTVLAAELDFIKNYVALQQMRIGEQFVFKLTCSDDLKVMQCPPFVLHTLVENAIVHGMDEQKDKLVVDVVITSSNNQLRIEVTNSVNPSSQANTSEGLGVALKNLKARLALLFGTNSEVKQLSQANSYQATVELPLKAHDDD